MKDITRKKYLFFGAGRIIKIKGCHLLIEALLQIKYQGQILIVGDINQDSTYKKYLLEKSQGLDINFLGLIRDKTQLLKLIAESQLFIFPSLMEAMSMMLLEAASVKASIICSDIQSNRDIFNNDEVLFFRSEDKGDLAEKINFALNNTEKMNEIANNAYEKVYMKYRWDIIAKEYSRLYNNLINHS